MQSCRKESDKYFTKEKDMQTQKKIMIALVMLSLLFGVTTLWAESNPQSSKRTPTKRQDIMSSLNLSPDQIKQRNALREPFQRTIIDLQAKRINKQLELGEALNIVKPDVSKVDGLVNDISAIQGSLLKADIKYQLELRSILMPYQKTKLAKLKPGEFLGGGIDSRKISDQQSPFSKENPARQIDEEPLF